MTGDKPCESLKLFSQQNSHCSNKLELYSRLLSYMLLDCAQILKGSGFFWRVRVPSAGS